MEAKSKYLSLAHPKTNPKNRRKFEDDIDKLWFLRQKLIYNLDYNKRGKLTWAINLENHILSCFNKSNDPFIFECLSLCREVKGDHKLAISYLEKNIKLLKNATASQKKRWLLSSYSLRDLCAEMKNLALYYAEIEDYDNAIKNYQQAIKFSKSNHFRVSKEDKKVLQDMVTDRDEALMLKKCVLPS